jgi:hypothetical protein
MHKKYFSVNLLNCISQTLCQAFLRPLAFLRKMGGCQQPIIVGTFLALCPRSIAQEGSTFVCNALGSRLTSGAV